MKSLTLIIALILSVTFSNAQEEEEKNKSNISVTIENITSNNGHVILSLHTKETFMKSEGIQMKKSKIVDGKISVTFKNVAPGSYAIMALHDENDNNRMDFEDNGMPKESYGMSNNPMLMGPPQYAQAKFELQKENLDLKIIF